MSGGEVGSKRFNNARSASTPARPRSAPSSIGGNRGTQRRPSSAGHGTQSRPSSGARERSAGKPFGDDLCQRRRPQSAPTMLRGWDGQRLMRHAHEDDFLQNMEDTEVRGNIEGFKGEKLIIKDKVAGIDALTDSSLYDLKVLHSGAQRSKQRPQSAGALGRPASAGATGRPQSAGAAGRPGGPGESLDASASRMRDLCQEMVVDLHKGCGRLSTTKMDSNTIEQLKQFMKPMETEETKKIRERNEMLAGLGGFFKKAAAAGDKVAETEGSQPLEGELPSPEITLLEKDVDTTADQGFQQPSITKRFSLSGKISMIPQQLPVSTSQAFATARLADLVGFLIGRCGSVAAAFTKLDINGDRSLALQEWEDGVGALGFKDDVSYVFKLLGKNGSLSASLDEVEALFDPFLKRTPAVGGS